ncbi:MAG: hypothetical protein IKD25_09570 [Bacteroidaceae bacterium]|nr:hypothetical protein [Bacteroidaceae bacterium]
MKKIFTSRSIYRCYAHDFDVGNLRDSRCVKNKAPSKRLSYVIPFDIALPHPLDSSSIGANYVPEK